jgi:hypothetical protein
MLDAAARINTLLGVLAVLNWGNSGSGWWSQVTHGLSAGVMPQVEPDRVQKVVEALGTLPPPVARKVRSAFTPALQALATLAGVIEPYDAPSTELLGRFAGVAVSGEKIQALVRQEEASASEVPAADVSTAGPPTSGPVCRPAAHEARRHAVASTGRRRHARPSIRLPEHGRPGPILGRPSGRMNGCRLRPPGVGRANEKFASR